MKIFLKAETATNRICRVLRVNQENERLMEEYERLASDLLDWIRRWLPWLQDKKTDNTLPGVQKKLEDFRQYRRSEKPPRIEQKGRLETSFNTLQTKLRLSNRPSYIPSEGKLVKDIQNAWNNLEGAEKGFEDWLLSEMMRLERLELLAEKFRRKCKIHEEWAHGKEDELTSADWKRAQLYELKALRKRHVAFESDLAAHQDRVEQIAAIAQELNSLHYHDILSVNSRCQAICQQWDRLGSLSTQRRQNLEEAERLMERIDQLHLEFAKRAAPFNNWMDGAREDLQDMFIVHQLSEVSELMTAHDQFKATLPEAETEFRGILGLQQEVQRLIESHSLSMELLNSPYTQITGRELQSKWNEVQQLVPKRDSQLQQESIRQQQMDRLRHQFAEKANAVGPWLERQLDTVYQIGLGGSGSLETGIQRLQDIYQTIQAYKPNMDELERYNQELQENYIFENQYTHFTMETLRVGWENLVTSINRFVNEFENQKLTQNARGVSQTQINELRSSYNHFDKQRKGLDQEEFKSCLISLGYNIKPGKEGDMELHRILAIVDPNRTGRVQFDAFLDFMTREITDTDSSAQIVESFRVLCGAKPYITADELRRELPPDQAEYCLQRMPPYGAAGTPGCYDYVAFAKGLYGESDL